ncbi:MAG: SDR family oxidoreductase [Eudoraea sp.]|nr:SDR family oxidoreductase [Eudoraea sp.]NNJ40328.1 SDR family oxidoreductase [Eudoraea sp.]
MANVIITGTSRGIGLELARLFAEEGHKVLALSRNTGPVAAMNQPLIGHFAFDITRESDIEAVVQYVKDNWGQVDYLVNNAGRLLNKPFIETTQAEFEAVYEVNVFGVAALIKAVLPFMNADGHVVNISSMGGVQGSAKFPGLSAYSSSKGALITLTELLAEECKENGPSFNVLALGAVQTEMLEEAFPGYQAPLSALEMAVYIKDFTLKGRKYYNGKLLPVSKSTP